MPSITDTYYITTTNNNMCVESTFECRASLVLVFFYKAARTHPLLTIALTRLEFMFMQYLFVFVFLCHVFKHVFCCLCERVSLCEFIFDSRSFFKRCLCSASRFDYGRSTSLISEREREYSISFYGCSFSLFLSDFIFFYNFNMRNKYATLGVKKISIFVFYLCFFVMNKIEFIIILLEF